MRACVDAGMRECGNAGMRGCVNAGGGNAIRATDELVTVTTYCVALRMLMRQAAADYGIDITQLRDNLTLTVAERLRCHQIALNTVERLQKATRQ